MGQFSWITQDTGEAVRECFGCKDKELTSAYMHDDRGNKWEEPSYEGYGVFAGKDFYQLIAEMNGVAVGDLAEDRRIGIDLAFGSKPYKSPNITRNRKWEWRNEAPEADPNQGWGEEEDEECYGDCEYCS